MTKSQMRRANVPHPLRINTSNINNMHSRNQTEDVRTLVQKFEPQLLNVRTYQETELQLSMATKSYGGLRQLMVPSVQGDRNQYGPRPRQDQTSIVNSCTDSQHDEYIKRDKRKAVRTPQSHGGPTLVQVQSASVDSAAILVNRYPLSDAASGVIHTPRNTCQKCGKAKRPTSSFTNSSISESKLPHHLNEPQSTYSGGQYAIWSAMTHVPRRKPLPSQAQVYRFSNSTIDIDIEPPTAVSDGPRSNILTRQDIEASSLLEYQSPDQPHRPLRTTSISSFASSIMRVFTKTRRLDGEGIGGSPSPQRANRKHDFGDIRVIRMISNGIRRKQPQPYTEVQDETEIDKLPDGPFSFLANKSEDSVELENIGGFRFDQAESWSQINLGSPEADSRSQDPFGDPESILRPSHLRTRSTFFIESVDIPTVPDNDIFPIVLNQPTELTRFKSLTDGARRAGSVARSTSLKRLNSLKQASELWYRTDMAFEGATVGVV